MINMEKSKLLVLKNRKDIYKLINKNPGLHFRKISRKLSIPISTLEYHLRYLLKHELIISKYKGQYHRYYVQKKSSYKYKQYFPILRNETSRNIFLLILSNTVSSRREISNELELHPNTVSKQLKRLEEMQIIEPAPKKDGYFLYVINKGEYGQIKRTIHGRETFYRITESAGVLLYETLIVYKKSIFENPQFKLILDHIEEVVNKGCPKKLYEIPTATDIVVNTVYNIFPHPYHC